MSFFIGFSRPSDLSGSGLLDLRAAARYIGYSESNLRKLIRAGKSHTNNEAKPPAFVSENRP